MLKDIADKLKLATPWINYLIEWHQVCALRLVREGASSLSESCSCFHIPIHQGYMKKEYLVDGKLIGRDMPECTALTVLGMLTLSQLSLCKL